jgi:hypothetical protein
MKNGGIMNIKRIISHGRKNPYIIPGLVLVLLMGVLHFIFPIFSDDIWLISAVRTASWWELVSSRFSGWTSRVVIDAVMFLLSRNWYVFLFTNLIMFVLLYVFSLKTFLGKVGRRECWFCVFMILIFPFGSFSSAGLMGTSLNYLWPLTTALIFGYSLRKVVLSTDRIKPWEYFIYILLLLFAANMETVGVLLLGVILTIIIYMLLNKMGLSKYLVLSAIITAGMTVIALIAPGNEQRRIIEIQWMPNFMMFSPVEQIQIGYAYAVFSLIVGISMIFTIFSLLLFLAVLLQHKEKSFRGIAFVPIGASLIFSAISVIQQFVFVPGINEVLVYGFNLDHLVRVANYNLISSYVPLMISGAIIIFVFSSLIICFYEDIKVAWFYIILVVLGLATAVAMGFSPTIYVTGQRAHTYALYIFVLLSLVLYQKLRDLKFKYEWVIFWGLGLLGLSIGSLRVILRVVNVPFLN